MATRDIAIACQDDRRRIAARIEDKLGAAGRRLARLDELELGDTALLRVAFGRWQAPPLSFTHEGRDGLARAVQADEAAPPLHVTPATPATPADPARPPRRDKLVQVHRIVMDGDAIEAATGMDLGANSKLDRDPRLKEALCQHGQLQARRYLTLRSQVERLCGELGHTSAGACGSAAGVDADGAGDACRTTAGRGELVLDGTTLYDTGLAGGNAPRALVRWRTVGAEVGGRPVRIEGRSELADDMDSGSEWRVKDVRITVVVPKKGATPQPGAAPGRAWPERHTGDGSGRRQ